MTENTLSPRHERRTIFIQQHVGKTYTQDEMPPGYSPRRFFRITKSTGETAVLIDADGVMPPPTGPLSEYVQMAEYFKSCGVSAPEIYDFDEAQGFLLHEDFGDDTYDSLLQSDKTQAYPLYQNAVDTLIAIRNANIPVPKNLRRYDIDFSLEQVRFMMDWYWPAIKQHEMAPDRRAEFEGIWQRTFAQLPKNVPMAATHCDFNSSNLLHLPKRKGHLACGMVDFQDGFFYGPAIFDFMSLVKELRHDLPIEWENTLFERFTAGFSPEEIEASKAWMAWLNAERDIRHLGSFMAYIVRTGNTQSLEIFPKFTAFLKQALAHDALSDVRAWFEMHLPDYDKPLDVAAVQKFKQVA